MSDNLLNHVLACLAEECGEATQAVGKALRWGLESSHPDYDNIPNKELIRKEVHDIIAMYELLMDLYDEDSDIDGDLINNKRISVMERYKSVYLIGDNYVKPD